MNTFESLDKFRSQLATIAELNLPVHSQLAKAVEQISRENRLFDYTEKLRQAFIPFLEESERYDKLLKAFSPFQELHDTLKISNAFASHAQTIADQFANLKLGERYNFSEIGSIGLYANFTSLTKAFTSAFDSIESAKLNPVYFESISESYFASANLLREWSVDQTGELVDDPEIAIKERDDYDILQLLGMLRPNLATRWEAAIKAGYDANPENTVHFSVTMRRIMNTVINELAPTPKKVKRDARVRRIFDGRPDLLAAYMNKDIVSIGGLWKIVDTEIHNEAETPTIATEAIAGLIRKMEGTLRIILKAGLNLD